MASSWFQSWGTSWGDSWGASVAPPVVETRGGGYLTAEEMRRLARWQRKKDEEKRELDKSLEDSFREAYDDIVSPEIKIARQRAMQESDDEEALITMILHHYRSAA